MKRVRIQRTRNKYRSSHLFLAGIRGLCEVFLIAPVERNRKEALQRAKIEKLVQDREIGQIVQGIKSNQLMLQDIQIEIKKLELIALKRKLGDPDSPFAPPLNDV